MSVKLKSEDIGVIRLCKHGLQYLVEIDCLLYGDEWQLQNTERNERVKKAMDKSIILKWIEKMKK